MLAVLPAELPASTLLRFSFQAFSVLIVAEQHPVRSAIFQQMKSTSF